MKKYIKKFETAEAGDNYSITDIPFMTSVETSGQNLVCNETGKKLVNESGILKIQSDGPEMVDLGLSVKWANANLGATCGNTAESWYGGHYAWGETETKSDYSWGTYKHTNGTYSSSNKKVFIKYIPTNKPEYWNGEGDPDNKLILDAVDDIAAVEFGSNYRMPTKAEIEELIELPNKLVTNHNGVHGLNGRVFTGTNGNTLFIPAAGYFDGSTHDLVGSRCFLWAGSLNSDYTYGAWDLYFNSGSISLGSNDRCYGYSVRCVSKD